MIPPSLDCILEVKAGCSVEGGAWARASTSVAPSRGSGAAHERLRALASEHYSDANLLLMLASLLTVWAGGMATPFASAGEKDGALEALARAIEAVTLEHQDATDSPLWDRMADRLDPACAGEAWAEHKARQADEARLLIRQGLAERTSSPEWQRIVSEDPRYRDILAKAPR